MKSLATCGAGGLLPALLLALPASLALVVAAFFASGSSKISSEPSLLHCATT